MCPHLWVHLCLFLRLLCQKMISPGPKTILAAAKHDSVHSKYKYMYKCIVIGTLGRGTSFMGLLMLVANAYWAKKWKKIVQYKWIWVFNNFKSKNHFMFNFRSLFENIEETFTKIALFNHFIRLLWDRRRDLFCSNFSVCLVNNELPRSICHGDYYVFLRGELNVVKHFRSLSSWLMS